MLWVILLFTVSAATPAQDDDDARPGKPTWDATPAALLPVPTALEGAHLVCRQPASTVSPTEAPEQPQKAWAVPAYRNPEYG